MKLNDEQKQELAAAIATVRAYEREMSEGDIDNPWSERSDELIDNLVSHIKALDQALTEDRRKSRSAPDGANDFETMIEEELENLTDL